MGKTLTFEEPIVKLREKIIELEEFTANNSVDFQMKLEHLKVRLKNLKKKFMEIWNHGIVFKLRDTQNVQQQLIISTMLFEDFMQLHGDRDYGDDAAIVGGIASFESSSNNSYWPSTWERYEREC